MKYILANYSTGLDIIVYSEELMFYVVALVDGVIITDVGISEDMPFPLNINGSIEEEE